MAVVKGDLVPNVGDEFPMNQEIGEPTLKIQYGRCGLLHDDEIRRLCVMENMITPFVDSLQEEGVISYGLDSYGYDVRVGYKFKVFTNVYGAVIDPKNVRPEAFVDVDLTPVNHAWISDRNGQPKNGYCQYCFLRMDYPESKEACKVKTPPDHIVIPPNSFALAETVEAFAIPRDVKGLCLGKSTYARSAVVTPMTPLEPGWEGKLTLEIANVCPLPVRVYAGEGIASVAFFRGSWPYRRSYADRKGKYQNQPGLTLPRVK